MRRELVTVAVAREERDAPSLDGADRQRTRRLPVRGVDLDLLDLVEEAVEAGASEDADLGLAQADFSFAPPDAELASVLAPSFFAGSFFAPSPAFFAPSPLDARESVA